MASDLTLGIAPARFVEPLKQPSEGIHLRIPAFSIRGFDTAWGLLGSVTSVTLAFTTSGATAGLKYAKIAGRNPTVALKPQETIMAKRKAPPARGEAHIGKRVMFDEATWAALDLYARDSMRTFQELADEAFADLLRKHGRPTDLTDALRRSARAIGANDNPGRSRRTR
jgi:hypothetical protein